MDRKSKVHISELHCLLLRDVRVRQDCCVDGLIDIMWLPSLRLIISGFGGSMNAMEREGMVGGCIGWLSAKYGFGVPKTQLFVCRDPEHVASVRTLCVCCGSKPTGD